MKGNYVITVARGFGSGGKSISMKLAERLGISCYERDILKMASDESGINEEIFSKNDEKLTGGFLKRLHSYENRIIQPSDKDFVSNDNLFTIQTQIIKKLAETDSCIIVGKCADYVLRDYDHVISFYIEAPRAACVASIRNKMCVTEQEAHRLIEKTDKYRADYYKYYTHGKDWTNPTNYDLVLNSDKMGRAECVDIMEMYIKYKLKEWQQEDEFKHKQGK